MCPSPTNFVTAIPVITSDVIGPIWLKSAHNINKPPILRNAIRWVGTYRIMLRKCLVVFLFYHGFNCRWGVDSSFIANSSRVSLCIISLIVARECKNRWGKLYFIIRSIDIVGNYTCSTTHRIHGAERSCRGVWAVSSLGRVSASRFGTSTWGYCARTLIYGTWVGVCVCVCGGGVFSSLADFAFCMSRTALVGGVSRQTFASSLGIVPAVGLRFMIFRP